MGNIFRAVTGQFHSAGKIGRTKKNLSRVGKSHYPRENMVSVTATYLTFAMYDFECCLE